MGCLIGRFAVERADTLDHRYAADSLYGDALQGSPATMNEKIRALRARLLAHQRELIMAAANAGAIPSDNTLRKIADIEVTIGAIEAMLEEERAA